MKRRTRRQKAEIIEYKQVKTAAGGSGSSGGGPHTPSDLHIGKQLVQNCKITQAKLDEACKYASRKNMTLEIGQMLILMGCITPQDWQQAVVDAGE